MAREQNIATQEQAAEKLNAGDIDGAVDTLFPVQIVERWGATDELGIMQQIGAV